RTASASSGRTRAASSTPPRHGTWRPYGLTRWGSISATSFPSSANPRRGLLQTPRVAVGGRQAAVVPAPGGARLLQRLLSALRFREGGPGRAVSDLRPMAGSAFGRFERAASAGAGVRGGAFAGPRGLRRSGQ